MLAHWNLRRWDDGGPARNQKLVEQIKGAIWATEGRERAIVETVRVAVAPGMGPLILRVLSPIADRLKGFALVSGGPGNAWDTKAGKGRIDRLMLRLEKPLVFPELIHLEIGHGTIAEPKFIPLLVRSAPKLETLDLMTDGTYSGHVRPISSSESDSSPFDFVNGLRKLRRLSDRRRKFTARNQADGVSDDL
jgi:hypothetical protein